METGQRGVSGLELYRLAQLYSSDVGEFLEDRFEESSPVTAMFRAHPQLRESPVAVQSLRRRFSIAHEYAHVLLDRELKAILSHARDRSSWMEVRANAFAASFLMPAEGVRSQRLLQAGLGTECGPVHEEVQ